MSTAPTFFSPLGAALGKCLQRVDGLTAAYLPEGVDVVFAEAIVRSANRLRPDSTPYAILVRVAADDDLSDLKCPRVSPSNALRYRKNNRLAVGVGHQPALHSFVQAFRPALDQTFPDTAPSGPSLETLAKASLDEVFASAGVPPSVIWARHEAEERLAHCLGNVRDVYRTLRQGTASWNVYWFRHVDEALISLAEGVRRAIAASPGDDLALIMARLTYASFALPTPKGNAMWLGKRAGADVGKDVSDALSDWWSSTDTISGTLSHLHVHPDTPSDHHPLGDLAWASFDRTMASQDNLFLALLRTIHTNKEAGLEGFAALTETQFLSPIAVGKADRRLTIRAESGKDLAVGEGKGASIVIVDPPLGGSTTSLSQPLHVRIPLGSLPDQSLISKSRLAIVSNVSGLEWISTGVSIDEDEDNPSLVLRGALQIAADVPVGAAPIKITMRTPAKDVLEPFVPASLAALVFLVPRSDDGLAWFRQGSGKYEGSILMASVADEGVSTVEVAVEQDYRIIAWAATGSDPAKPLLDGVALKAWDDDHPDVWFRDFRPSGLNTLDAGGRVTRFIAPEPEHPATSPIIAAIWKRSISPADVAPETVASLRGHYEENLVEHVNSEAWLEARGHVVLSAEGGSGSTVPYELTSDQAFLAPAGLASLWDGSPNFSVPDELVHSAEANDFRTAFRNLGIDRGMRLSENGGQKAQWVSRTSWRHLWGDYRSDLAAYLEAYSELMARARLMDSEAGVFWAAYPWSISVWDLKSAPRCQAVLLSPLHPLRLAWVAAVEATLWDADDPAALAGTIEGWNFPLVGPRNNKKGRMLAVPLDNGGGQVFLGWSMLVGASTDGPKALVAPAFAGRYRLPGSAASGLNAAAVDSALRDFRRVNPHVSTITIDLAAASRVSRLLEIDEAVLGAVTGWATRDAGARRTNGSLGVRVRDSLHRDGEPPRARLQQLVADGVDVPISWARYAPVPRQSEVCNVRLLQDAGVRVEMSSNDQVENRGIIGKVPLRRFEVGSQQSQQRGGVVSRPAIVAGVGWEPFANAMRLIEDAVQVPEIRAEVGHTLLVDDRATWTVAGESLVGPAALAKLIEHAGGGRQMLWEWRPPFLSADAGRKGNPEAVLERRPFVSVVRVPGSFRVELEALMSRLAGGASAPAVADHVLSVLGARGVGLSSLTAMGGTHAVGAMGFYLAMELMDEVSDPDADLVVLPIDACEPFLQALAPGEHGGSIRRADLLVIRIDRAAITMVPIEIKLYGLLANEPAGVLPQPLSMGQTASNPIEQLAATTQLLARIVERWREVSADTNGGNAPLWNNALLTLLEAGLRLRAGDAGDPLRLQAVLTSVAQGEIPVRLGAPVLCYLGHGAKTEAKAASAGYLALEHSDLDTPFGAFVANPGVVYSELNDVPGECVENWRRVIKFAMGPQGDEPTSVQPVDHSSSPTPEAQPAPERPPPPALTEAEEGPPAAEHTSALNELKAVREEAGEEEASIGITTPAASSPCPDGVRFPVGTFLSAGGQGDAEFWPGNTALTQMNIGVAGDLGTGKTQLLKALIANLRRESGQCQPASVSMLVFDYKVDYQDAEFLAAVGGHVLLPLHIPLNVFALADAYTPLAALQKARAFIDVLVKIYGGIGQIQRNELSEVITDLFKRADGASPTMSAVLAEYRSRVGAADSVVGIMNSFVMGEVFSDDPSKLIPFDELVADGVLVVALDALGTDQAMKNALVVLFLNQYYDYMHHLPKWPFLESTTGVHTRRLNSFLLVDEATNIMRYDFQVLGDLMLQGREFGVGVILSSQFLSHFKASGVNYGEPLRTWFIHKVPAVTRQQLISLGVSDATDAMARSVSELGKHEALYITEGVSGRVIRGTPFYEVDWTT